MLLSLDPQTLDVRRRTAIPFAEGSVDSAIAYGDKLVYPLTLNAASNTPGHDIVVLDPDTMKATRVNLGAKLPYLLRLDGNTLYVGHTFMHPAFGALSTLRHVSRVDLTTNAVTGYDLAAGIVDFDVRAGHLHLLGDDGGDDNTFVIQTYDASSGAKLTSQSVNRATGDGYYYPAGILAP